ncbi:hypothetical protein HNW77_03010 [Komagataeibacter sp. AV436]|uniref:Uncharacterized protein n=1 Tax=Komagataeibacter melomenusus TaxID=2766578 RepID=A0ABX2AC21_9PROT|nr:hypothetical protein [Komagataeibacter melomenusus]MBV1829906.1 hypothetical protein [Komagataeibacter melomenusus]NPC65394.1 hypothetical protein [Komagataeibacter melomenusus]
MLTLKQNATYGFVLLAGIMGMGLAHAAPAPEKLDCRHLLAEDVRLSDRLAALSHSEAQAEAQDKAPAEKGFFVKFDPVPGFGIMKGATLAPAGHPIREDATERNLDQVRQKLAVIRGHEQRRMCPEIGAPDMQQDRLSDDAVRAVP